MKTSTFKGTFGKISMVTKSRGKRNNTNVNVGVYGRDSEESCSTVEELWRRDSDVQERVTANICNDREHTAAKRWDSKQRDVRSSEFTLSKMTMLDSSSSEGSNLEDEGPIYRLDSNLEFSLCPEFSCNTEEGKTLVRGSSSKEREECEELDNQGQGASLCRQDSYLEFITSKKGFTIRKYMERRMGRIWGLIRRLGENKAARYVKRFGQG